MGKDLVKIVFNEIGITGCNQRQNLRSRIGHISCGVEPIFEEEKPAEDERGHLAFGKEVCGEQKRDQPLQQRASPKAERWTEPSEQIVAALVNDEIGSVNEQESAMGRESVGEESEIEHEPSNQGRTRDRLPGLIQHGLQVVEHCVHQIVWRPMRAGEITNVSYSESA